MTAECEPMDPAQPTDSATPVPVALPAPIPGRCNAAARSRGGAPCLNVAGFKTDHLGYGRCHIHGGNSPNHRKANLRLVQAMVPVALAELQRLVVDPDMPPSVKLRAAQDVLDRAGVGVRAPAAEDGRPPVEVRVQVLLERAAAVLSGATPVIDATLAVPAADDEGEADA